MQTEIEKKAQAIEQAKEAAISKIVFGAGKEYSPNASEQGFFRAGFAKGFDAGASEMREQMKPVVEGLLNSLQDIIAKW